MKKTVLCGLVALLSLSCTVQTPNNSQSVRENFIELAQKYNFAELEKEYKSFNTKGLSNAYVLRMFNKFLTTGNANPTQVIRQLEFARYLKEQTPSDPSYFNSLTAIISADPTIYDKINNTSGVGDKKSGEPNFRVFIDNLNPVQSSIPTNVILVKANATGANDGTSWANAYTSLQAALATSSSGGKNEIWIAAGTYNPAGTGGDRNASFQLKSGVNVYGGFAGTETELSQRNFNTNIVILSGDLNNNDTEGNFDLNKSDNSFHVVKGADNSIFDGVSVKFGYNDMNLSGNYWAGGMYNIEVSPTISNVIFSNNFSSVYGAGMGCENLSSPISITNVVFDNNKALYANGAGANIVGNSSGNPSVTVNNVIFKNNSAGSEGGGLRVDGQSGYIVNVSLTNVIFYQNYANSGGGGYKSTNFTSSTLNNVVFYANTSSSTVYNAMNTSGNATFTNVTFYNNALAAQGITTIKNSIFWEDDSYISTYGLINASAELNIGYSDVKGALDKISCSNKKDLSGNSISNATDFTNAGNINTDPLFLSPANLIGADNKWLTSDDGIALTSGSPALVKDGANSIADLLTDITGAVRPGGIGNSMGAYEK